MAGNGAEIGRRRPRCIRDVVAAQGWQTDPVMDESLCGIQDAKHEAELYDSLTALLNRIHVKAESMSDFRQDDALDVRLVGRQEHMPRPLQRTL